MQIYLHAKDKKKGAIKGMAFERQKLTKCEKLILKHIASTGECDYSFSEMSKNLGISRQTVYLCLNSLLEDKYIEKSYFFIGRIKRCKYSIVNFFAKKTSSKNFTMQKEGSKNFTRQNKLEERNNKTIGLGWVKSLWHKKESSHKTRLTLIENNNDIYIINNISNQSNNTMVLGSCQEVKLNFFKKIDKILGSSVQESNTVHSLKAVIKKIFCEKNDNAKAINKFFMQEEEQDLHDVLWCIINSVTRRMLDKTKSKIKNLYGYIRIALINAVEAFYASKVDESDAKTLLYESVKQLHCTPATSTSATVNPATVKHKINHCSLAHNFEQREYSKEYIESFCENAPVNPAPVNNKIDTSRLSRNFEQREYDKEYLESFYEKFDEPSSPATSSPVTSTPAKDIVMEQVRAIRDSFSTNRCIKPLPCVDLW